MGVAEHSVPTQFTGGKHLTFTIGGETYGLPIAKVREIIKIVAVTEVPGSAKTIRGIINLRGKVIPIIDMHAAFGLAGAADTERTCIVVVQTGSDGHLAGLVVDAVSEVVEVKLNDYDDLPDGLGQEKGRHFINGIAKFSNKVVLLLDIDQVPGTKESETIQELSNQSTLF